MDTLPKCKSKAKIDDAVLGREQYSEQRGDFIAHSVRFDEILVKLVHQARPHLKSMNGTCAGQHTLRKRISLCINVKYLGFQTSFDDARHCHDSNCSRSNAQRNEGQLPVCGKRNNEAGYESRQALEGQAKLFRDAALDKTAVCGGLR